MNAAPDQPSWGGLSPETADDRLAALVADLTDGVASTGAVVEGTLAEVEPWLAVQARPLAEMALLLCQFARALGAEPVVAAGVDPYRTLEPPDSPSTENWVKESPALTDHTVAVEAGFDPLPGKYRFVRRLGAGSFGDVWLAEHLHLHCLHVLKMFRASDDSDTAERMLAALRNDAQTMIQCSHPNVMKVLGWEQSGSLHFLVMDYYPGGSLADLLKRQRDGKFHWPVAARYVADTGEGLMKVHARGLVHRDVKPANILVDLEEDRAVLTDFGIASCFSLHGNIAGTYAYMAPEAYDGRISPEMDVFGLAATLFCLLTGTPPFPSKPPTLLLEVLKGLAANDPRCCIIPEPLETLIRAGLAAEAEQRPTLPQFVARLRGELNRLLADTFLTPGADAVLAAPVALRLRVWRQSPGGERQETVVTQASTVATRDMKKVPPRPELVRVQSGDRLRVEVSASQDGFVTVFNVGPTGNLNLLHPEQPLPPGAAPDLHAAHPLEILDVVMEPPTGRERLVAVWSRAPLTLTAEELRRVAAPAVSEEERPRVATRDMKRLRESVTQLPPQEWRAVGLELEHVLQPSVNPSAPGAVS